MTTKLRWGIVGTGWIATVFAEALTQSVHGEKRAVASRTRERAEAFRDRYGMAKAYGSYRELFADPEIDAVYISTPHTVHLTDTLAAIRAGKHVLCEKPLGVTAAECRRMVAAADRAGVVLLEAFMYRTHPQTLKLRELLAAGAIGTVRAVRSWFTFDLGSIPPGNNVRTNLALRGGSLYDVGGYCINFSRMVAGEEPRSISAAWKIDPDSGVDEACAGVLGFPSGVVAHFDVGLHSSPSAGAEVLGTKGRITVGSPWWPDPKRAVITLHLDGKPAEEIVVADGGVIFTIEADHMADVVAGRAEPLIPAANAIGNARVLETIWKQIHGPAGPGLPSRKAKAEPASKAKRATRAKARPGRSARKAR
jgi:predicted dehydrogenase